MSAGKGKAALSLSLLLFLGFAGVAGSADVGQPPAADFSERIDVRAVDVEVVVTDRSGQRVSGLAAADFKLQVDGKDVTIDHFAEVKEGQKAGGDVGTASTAASTTAAEAPDPAASAAGTSYLVFIDDSFSIAIQRNVVLDHLRADLALLAPGDRMAIVAWNGHKLESLSPWSGDTAALAAAFVKAKDLPTLGIHAKVERRDWSENRSLSASAAGDALIASTGLAETVPGRCASGFAISPLQCSELQETIGAAAAALRGMLDPGGRKVALLLSGGWPFGAGPHLFRPLLATADQLGYTLYPVDVPGIDPGSGADAARSAPADGTRFLSGGWERDSKDALEYLAASTGGKAILNSARLDALKRTVADTRSYYALGFSPVWRADDKGHTVKVSLKRAGLTARTRSGFTDLAPRTLRAMRAESVLLLGGAPGDRRLRLEIGSPKNHLTTFEAEITLGVPVSALTLTPEGQGYLAVADLSFVIQDEAGGRSYSDIPLRLKLPIAPVAGSYARYRTKVKLRRTGQTLVALLRDRESGATLWDEKAVGQ